MKKSDVFTPKYPAPTDGDLYDLYKTFMTLQKEVAQNWKQEVLTGMIGFRAYADLRDVRLSVHGYDDPEKDPALVISLRPIVGHDVVDEMAYYVQLFTTYKKLTNAIYLNACFPSFDDEDGPAIKREIHQQISALRLLLMAANHHVLTRDHLDILGDVEKLNDDEHIEIIDATIRGLGFSEFFSDKFEQEGGHYWEHPHQELVSAFCRWSQRRYILELNEM